MKKPLFDVILSAHTGEDGTGAFDVRIVGRYQAIDGLDLGTQENVTFLDAIEFATGAVDAFSAGVINARAN